MSAQKKVMEWVGRYLPAELCAIVGAVGGGLVIDFLFHNSVLTAFGATWGENVGYYGQILYQDMRAKGVLKGLRNILFEFGVAEYLDSLIIRPTAMHFLPLWLGNLPVGLLLGKLAADVVFYIPTIYFYELRKKYFKD